jgi:hypothetical protein
MAELILFPIVYLDHYPSHSKESRPTLLYGTF